MHRDEKRDLALLAAVGRLLHQSSDLTQDQAGNGRQRQLARLVKPHPANVTHLARMTDLAARVVGTRHEKARIEAPRPTRWRHSTRNQVEAIERRRHTLVQEAVPVLAIILFGNAALE